MNYKKMKWLLIPLVGMFVLWWIASVWIYTRNPKDHMEIIEAPQALRRLVLKSLDDLHRALAACRVSSTPPHGPSC